MAEKDLILLITNDRDEHAAEVERRLLENGARVARFDPGEFPSNARVEWSDKVHRIGDIDLDAVKTVWLRRCDYPTGDSDMHHADRAFAAQQGTSVLWSAADYLADRAFMANPLGAALANDGGHGKLNQLSKAQGLGLRTPRTLVTNDPLLAKDFVESCGGSALVKPFRSLASRLTYAWEIRSGDDLSAVRRSPWIFQEVILKTCDVRVAVFGKAKMATGIYSNYLDCRKDLTTAHHAHISLPSNVSSKLISLTRSLGLVMGIHDLILTPEGDYVYLETNQQGQFLWLEHKTGQPYLNVFTDFLMEANPDFT